LDGVARLEFDYDQAAQEDRTLRNRIREYEERHQEIIKEELHSAEEVQTAGF